MLPKQPETMTTKFYLLAFLMTLLMHTNGKAQIKPIRPFNSIKALVVGVSDYRDHRIPQLRYADRDAEAFAEFLTHESPWKVKEENLVLLTNEQATYGNFISEFTRLSGQCERNDRFILYFSGHGDVEVTSDKRMGYLLCHDAPPTTYASGGACMINTLDAFFQQLIQEQNVQVILISDACRSGTLAGSSYGGPQATTAALAELFSNTVKLLSCEAHQTSLEDKKWGSGRGVFSYYLVKGLRGQADADENRFVDLFELERYVQDEVLMASNQQQLPIRRGGTGNMKISRVRPEPQSREPAPALAQDTSYLPDLARFEQALANDHLLYPEEGSAYQVYQKIRQMPGTEAVQRLMTVSLSSALQDDAQAAINAYITTPMEVVAERWENEEVYSVYPDYLAKAAELVGQSSFFFREIKAREHYFRGVNLRLEAEANGLPKPKLEEALVLQQKALALTPVAPHIYNELGLLFRRLDRPAEELNAFQRANALSPTWGLALTNLAYTYKRQKQFGAAEELYKQAIAQDSSLALAYYNLGVLYESTERRAEAIQMYTAAMERDESYAAPVFSLANLYADEENRHEEALRLLRRYQQLEPEAFKGYDMMAYLYLYSDQLEAALPSAVRMYELDGGSNYSNDYLAYIYFELGRYEEALPFMAQRLQHGPEEAAHYLELAACQAQLGQNANGLATLEALLARLEVSLEKLEGLDQLAPVRSTAGYRALLDQYFPDRD
jgi:tetratricopeptide (TPR) repeat protein